jgi:MscS family membrane protein
VAPQQPEPASPATTESSQPTFGLDRIEFLRREVLGFPLWQFAASLLWVVVAFLVGGVVDWLVTRQFKKLAAKTQTKYDDQIIEAAHKPIKFFVFLLVLQLGVKVFNWPVVAERVFAGFFAIAIAGCIAYLIIKLVDVLVEYLKDRLFAADMELAKLLMPVLGKSLKVFILIVAALTTAQYLGLPVTSVIAGLGVGGIAIALAAQNTLANFFGSITILADRPFRVGDRVQVDKYDGHIETIGLRSTRLRTLEGHLVIIPNKVMADTAICNVSAQPNIRHLLTLNLTYDTSADKMRQAVEMLREIFKAHPQLHDSVVYWRDFGPHSLDILVVYWCKTRDLKEFLKINEEINLEIKRRFDAAGLDFAFPTQTIHLETGNPPL